MLVFAEEQRSKTGGSAEKPTKQGRAPTITATDTYPQI